VILEGRECAETKAPISPELLTQEPEPLGMCKVRRYVRLGGLSLPVAIVPFNHTFQNLVRAVSERVFFVKRDGVFTRPPTPISFAKTLSGVKARLHTFLPSTVPWTYSQMIESYKGRKKKVYEAAYNDLFTEGPVCCKDAEVEIFIKYEKTDCTTKQDPVPRVISPRSPKYNLCLGRFLKKLEPKIFKSIAQLFGSTTVIKGFNSYEVASILRKKWLRFPEPVAIGLDASRFDQHVSVDALTWEHQVYLDCFPLKRHKRKLAQLLKYQLNNHCVGYTPNGKVKYKIQGTRMSGDMNTSLGNCLLMCSMIKAYSECCRVDIELANNGDDCVVFMDKKNLERFSAGLYDWFLNMGFDMKVEEPVYCFERVEFCQTRPIFDGNRWLMCRNLEAVFSKDTTFLQPYQSKKQIANWLYAVGQGGLRLTGGLPVFQNFYRAYLKYGKPGLIPRDYMSWYMRKMLNGMDRDFGPVTPEARESFYLGFGICPEEQLILEHQIDQWKFDFRCKESDQEDFLAEYCRM